MDETLDRTRDSLDRVPSASNKRWCLIRIWSRRSAEGAGELAWLDGPRVLGRTGGPRPLSWIRQRPGHEEPGHSIASTYISREQIHFRAMGPASVEFRNVGRLELRVNGRPMRHGQAVAGDRLELDGELVVLLQRRGPLDGVAEHGFGDPCRDGMVGESPAMATLRANLARVAPLRDHVRIVGPSGTGKEAAAHALHRMSGRPGPLVTCNAAAIPVGLAAAEWFGNVRNYPNPSTPARAGLTARADKGTLLVDEIGELPSALQAQLLRFLDCGEVQRLGAPAAVQVDTRVVAASHRPLGTLNHDLAARFAHHITVPGLEDRLEDLALLVPHILRQRGFERFVRDGIPRVTPRLWESLFTRTWTGHVRELEQILWNAAQRAERDWLDAPRSTERPDTTTPPEVDADAIRAALEANGGVKTRAAEALGLRSRHQLRRLMLKYGMT